MEKGWDINDPFKVVAPMTRTPHNRPYFVVLPSAQSTTCYPLLVAVLPPPLLQYPSSFLPTSQHCGSSHIESGSLSICVSSLQGLFLSHLCTDAC